ncbi:MAG: zinc-ribbon domain-containing protein [Anaeroplasmataceae bacterium]|nr:zinc-ribbon domain-containing protein [Anaeroplasmataceae bacterium]
MNCRYCNAENDEDAVYCINCGKKLDGELICPSCGAKNEGDAKFCKECGHNLFKSAPKEGAISKEKGLSIGNLVLKIIAVSMAAFIILFSFGSCFAPFITGFGQGMNLFDFINDLKDFKPKPSGIYGSDFYMIEQTMPNIICISGISIALIGCTAALIWGTVIAIRTSMKKQIPNLDQQGLLATCSLLTALLFSSLIFMYSKAPSGSLSVNFSIKYGGVVLAAVSVGLAWYFLNYICHFVLDIIKGLKKKEILNRAFKLGEAILLCVILFNLCSSFMSFVQLEENWIGERGKVVFGMSIGAFFTNLSESIYYKTSDMDFVFSTSNVAGGYYLAMAILIVFIVILVAGVSIIFIRLKNTSDKTKASLITAIPLVVMATVELALTIAAINVFSKPDGVFQMVLGENIVETREYVGSSIIVFMVFSLLVLALEIIWMILNKNIKDEKESEAYDM